MSVKAIGHVWDLDLPANKRLVLLAYTDHADHDGNSMWPSVALIAWKTGYSERSVKRITKELVEDDKILIEDGRGKHGVKRYRLDWDAGVKKEPLERANLTPKADDTQQSAKVSPKANDKRSDILTPKGDPAQESDILSKQSDILSKQSDIAMSPKPSLEPSIEPSIKEKDSALRAEPDENLFDIIHEYSFDSQPVVKSDGALIGILKAWLEGRQPTKRQGSRGLKQLVPASNPAELRKFYSWYRTTPAGQDSAYPIDVIKFQNHFCAFRQIYPPPGILREKVRPAHGFGYAEEVIALTPVENPADPNLPFCNLTAEQLAEIEALKAKCGVWGVR